METQIKIKVTYDWPLDSELDDVIKKAIETLGAEWYAQGTDLETGIRELVFDWWKITDGVNFPATAQP